VNSQTERTRLAWRRTILTVLAVGGLGALHLALAGFPLGAALAGVLAMAGCVPALNRLTALRRGHVPARWQPAALTVTTCLLALSVLVTG
jgi:uncharacterized membrane protein YidH (DUF202 family)